MKKKSQGGTNAAILIAIISAMIIVYIIFQPKSIGIDNQNNPVDNSKVILKESPGKLSASKGLGEDKKIPNVFLVEKTESKELKKINPLIVSNGLFDKKERKVDFGLDDYQNTENALLSFTAKKMSGVLTIKLNGAVIFENELSGSVIEPISLDKNLLAKTNSLEFSVSSPGARFWAANEYDLENIRIVGDINDISRQESANIFSLSDSQFSSLDKATLKFIPYCGNVKNIGLLEVLINNKRLFSNVPACNNAYRQDVPKSVLNQGENNIVFKTASGTYSIEQIIVSLEFKDSASKTYYFEIDEDSFNSIRAGRGSVEIKMKFVNDQKQKRAKLDINGHFESVDTNKNEFNERVNSKVSQGNNYIRIEPVEDLEVVELTVRVV